MDKRIKNVLIWGGAFLAYRLVKLYEIGENVIYKPVGISFTRGATINDFVVRVKMELLNPTNTIVNMKGIDGKLIVENQTIGSFSSPPFQIKGGINYFFLDFRIDPNTIGVNLVQSILKKKIPLFIVEINKRLQFFSIKERFALNPNNVDTSNVIVK